MSVQEERRTLYSVEDHIATITINRPPRNAMTHKDIRELGALVLEADADDNVRVIVLTGSGEKAFSVGGDVKVLFKKGSEIRDNPDAMDAETRDELELKGAEHLYKTNEESHKELMYKVLMGINEEQPRVHHSLRKIRTPSIAAVNGDAIGLACEIALCCDMRVVSENARFSIPYVKLGVMPGVTLELLSKIVGLSKAYEMLLTGDLIDAEEAYRIGIANKVVPQKDLMNSTMELASRIANNPPAAVKIIKEGMRKFLNLRMEEMRVFSATGWQLLHRSDYHKEAVNAFIEKRKPVFTGKL
jgi:2-(1,2-epoxy-1,2-dihydrophenyl)acetyl-CoA isomerase